MNIISTEDTFSGTGFLAIQSALKVLARRRIEASDYTITVLRGGEAVLFTADNRQKTPQDLLTLGVKRDPNDEMNSAEVNATLAGLDRFETLEKHRGRHYNAAQAAAEEFLRKFPAELARYRIEVLREGESLIVTFAGKDIPAGTRGAIPGTPGFEVELDPGSLKVRRSNFVR